jgi:hypothetical protein
MELHNMPNNFVHAIYKMYHEQMSTEQGRKALAEEQAGSKLLEAMTGG